MFVLAAIVSQKQREKYLYSLFDGIFLNDPNYVIQNNIIRVEDKFLVLAIQGYIKYSNIFFFCNVVFNIAPSKNMLLNGFLSLEYILIAQETIIFTIIKPFIPITESLYIKEYSPMVTSVIPRR